jgi:hypothetical protein
MDSIFDGFSISAPLMLAGQLLSTCVRAIICRQVLNQSDRMVMRPPGINWTKACLSGFVDNRRFPEFLFQKDAPLSGASAVLNLNHDLIRQR